MVAEVFPNPSTDQTSYEYARFESSWVSTTACCRTRAGSLVTVIDPPVNPYRTTEVETLSVFQTIVAAFSVMPVAEGEPMITGFVVSASTVSRNSRHVLVSNTSHAVTLTVYTPTSAGTGVYDITPVSPSIEKSCVPAVNWLL
ncbi:MAG: hypothetical protein BWY06_03288 [Candidatus Latescibacteria bacterium ADurb.Bin168]|nr:MAG: hypothetical protein BWY06_03288 [Candidatus Latescibacteria bacterium ADurb.Bin168]